MRALGRREWLLTAGGLVAGAAVGSRALAQTTPAAKQRPGAADPLQNPDWVGRPRDVVDTADNNFTVTAAEHRLRCTCGCGLDVFTCRTTDFTCTYSPALHKEVVALVESGKSVEQVVDAFVAKYSETILMAPKAQGFGVVGYWLPASALALAAGLLAWILLRRSNRDRPASVARPVQALTGPDLSATERARLDDALRDIPR